MLKKILVWWDKYFAGPKPLDVGALLKGAQWVLPEGTTWDPILERLKVVELKPGDTLVLETAYKLGDRAYQVISEQLKKKSYQTMILEEGITLRAILRQDTAQPAPEAKK